MKKCSENDISYIAFNNRGSELIKYVTIYKNDSVVKELGGVAYEDVLDGYLDIKAAMEKAIELGYNEIYLQGHSLGSTKVLYTYNKLKKENSGLIKYIKGVMLLSLVDIPRALKTYSKDRFEEMQDLAEKFENEGKTDMLMPTESFIHFISVKSFLRYVRDNKDFDFARYSDDNYDFKELNNVNVKLFMRWGNVYEMIEQDAKELVEILNKKINNLDKDISYIDGADHGYNGKEEMLAEQIIRFLSN